MILVCHSVCLPRLALIHAQMNVAMATVGIMTAAILHITAVGVRQSVIVFPANVGLRLAAPEFFQLPELDGVASSLWLADSFSAHFLCKNLSP